MSLTNSNLITFNNSDEKLMNLAINRRDEGDLVGAISTLLSLENKGTKLIEIYALIGSVYIDLKLYTIAIKYWFKYLASCPKSKQPRAYNALGACFYHNKNYAVCGYYFECQVSQANDGVYDYDDIMMEYFEGVYDVAKPEFYICHPPDRIPAAIHIENGDHFFSIDEYDLAIENFLKVLNSEELYVIAQIKIAACLFCKKDYEKSISTLNCLIEADPTNKTALLGMIGMLFSMSEYELCEPYFELCEQLEFIESEECYKLATAYCDAGKHLQAKHYLEKSIQDNAYDVNSLFLLGMVNYNLHDFSSAEKNFSTCYRITRSPVSGYYFKLCSDTQAGRIKFKEIDYFFNVPKEEIKNRIEYIHSLLKGGEKAVLAANKKELIEICEWAFSYEGKMQETFVDLFLCVDNPAMRKYFINQLINPSINDTIKSVIIKCLVKIGFDKKIGIVFGNIFSKIQFYRIEFEKEKNHLFKSAYALAFGKIAPIEPERAYKLKDGATKLYYTLFENGNLKKVDDVDALASAIVILSELQVSQKKDAIANYFEIEKTKINKILSLLKEK